MSVERNDQLFSGREIMLQLVTPAAGDLALSAPPEGVVVVPSADEGDDNVRVFVPYVEVDDGEDVAAVLTGGV